MFKKSPKPDDLAARRNDLQARLRAAEDHLTKLRADAVNAAGNAEADRLAGLSESAFRIEFEINALRAAIEQAEHEAAEAAENARRAADKAQREATAEELHKLADGLEKAAAPVPGVLLALRDAISAAVPIIGPNGFPDLLGNLGAEIPSAIELFVSELRARAAQTLAGTAPATLPAPPVLTIIEEPPATETIEVFANESLCWKDHRGQLARLDAHHIGQLPVHAAETALARNLAYKLDDSRFLKMRETARKVGLPHLVDPQKVYDLDRDPNTASVYSSGGKKLREEPTFEIMASRPPRQAEWVKP